MIAFKEKTSIPRFQPGVHYDTSSKTHLVITDTRSTPPKVHRIRIEQGIGEDKEKTLPTCRWAESKTGEMFPPADGLGDYLASAFESLGITPESYVAAKKRFLSDTQGCGCGWRHKLANKIGEFFGMSEGKGKELRDLVAVETIGEQPVFGCEKKGRCVKIDGLNEEQTGIINDAGYAVCNCELYEAKQ